MEVRDIDGMKGLFSTKKYSKGDVFYTIKGIEINYPTRTSIQVGEDKHIEVDFPVMYINHGCNDNIELNGMQLIVIKDISEGEEILFDYNKNEYDMSDPFNCRECGQLIKGLKYKDQFPCLNKNL